MIWMQIITIVHYAWQNGTPELIVSRYFFFGTGHSDVAFVNEQGFCIGHKFIHFELKRIPGLVQALKIVYSSWITLRAHAGMRSPSHLPIPLSVCKVAGASLPLRAIEFPKHNFKLSELIFFVFLPLLKSPIRKIAVALDCPLSENPAIGSMMKSKIQITRCEIGKTAFFARQLRFSTER